MFDKIDIYCERMSPDFWAEPLNAISNISFLIAAYFGYKLLKNGKKQPDLIALIAICASVGIGSFLFHTFAVTWALYADVIPIGIFIYTAIGIFLKRVIGLSNLKTAIGLATFFLIGYANSQLIPKEALNGSVEYLPALLALIIFGLWSKIKTFYLASGIFILSLTFRSLDMQLCSLTLGFGTHIFWHLLNGYLLYLVIKGLVIGSKR